MPDRRSAHPIYWPIAALREAYVRGEISPAEVLDDALARLAAFNPRLNAFLSTLAELAGEQAAAATGAYRSGMAGPLAGIPISIKSAPAAARPAKSWAEVSRSGSPAVR